LAKASLGTFFAPNTGGSNANIKASAADGAGWVVCSNADSYASCNGGVGVNAATDGSETAH